MAKVKYSHSDNGVAKMTDTICCEEFTYLGYKRNKGEGGNMLLQTP
jgi:hypothetical protein